MPKSKKQGNKNVIEESIIKKIERIKAKSKASVIEPTLKSKKVVTVKKNKKSKILSPETCCSSQDDDSRKNDSEYGESTPLMLNDVLELGGTQDDFDMLKGISDNDDELEVTHKDIDFNVAELITFMKSNGMKTTKKSKEKQTKSRDEKVEDAKSATTVKDCPFVPSNPLPHERLIFKTNEPWYDIHIYNSLLFVSQLFAHGRTG